KHDMLRLIEQIKKAETYKRRPTDEGYYRSDASTPARFTFIALGSVVLLIAVALGAILPRLSPGGTPIVTATQSETVTLTPVPSVTSSPELTAIPTETATLLVTPVPSVTSFPAPIAVPVGQKAITKVNTNVWQYPRAVRGDKYFSVDAGITVIIIG